MGAYLGILGPVVIVGSLVMMAIIPGFAPIGAVALLAVLVAYLAGGAWWFIKGKPDVDGAAADVAQSHSISELAAITHERHEQRRRAR